MYVDDKLKSLIIVHNNRKSVWYYVCEEKENMRIKYYLQHEIKSSENKYNFNLGWIRRNNFSRCRYGEYKNVAFSQVSAPSFSLSK